LFNARIEYWLDQGYGSCLLEHPVNKETLEKALRHFDGQRYHLGEYVVMPNHVHALITPIGDHQLSEILHSWKSFTANTINKREGLSGAFWQKEYFDHIVRTPDQMERVILYIKQNPVPRSEQDLQVLYDETFRIEKKEASGGPSRSAILALSKQKAAGSRFYPAAGTFNAWPEHLGELKVMDPCCGSGHFLVAAFQMLVPLRMALEHLSAHDAVVAVLTDHLHGLELDQRCVEIAAFALALSAWRYPDAGGYRPLPQLNLACSGLGIHAAKADWLLLADSDVDLEHVLEHLYDLFKDAPMLGSLIDPLSLFGDGLFAQEWGRIAPLLDRALVEAASSRLSEQDQRRELGVVAQGLARSAQLLAEQYHLVITNVPYLSRGKQSARLKTFCEAHYPNAKNDLANVFLERCLALAQPGGAGVVQIVMPQNWLFLTSYRKQREQLLREVTWNLLVRLGPGAFETISGEVVKAILLTQTRARPVEAASSRLDRSNAAGSRIYGLDASSPRTTVEKAELLRADAGVVVSQEGQLGNPDALIKLEPRSTSALIRDHAGCFQGLTTGDDPRLKRQFWEVAVIAYGFVSWERLQGPSQGKGLFSGRECLVDKRVTTGELRTGALRGREAWGKRGVAIDRVRSLSAAIYSGDFYHSLIPVIVPKDEKYLPAILAFALSDRLRLSAREANQALSIDKGYFEKFEFDLAYWAAASSARPAGYP